LAATFKYGLFVATPAKRQAFNAKNFNNINNLVAQLGRRGPTEIKRFAAELFFAPTNWG